jgi:hypothetical protein
MSKPLVHPNFFNSTTWNKFSKPPLQHPASRLIFTSSRSLPQLIFDTCCSMWHHNWLALFQRMLHALRHGARLALSYQKLASQLLRNSQNVRRTGGNTVLTCIVPSSVPAVRKAEVNNRQSSLARLELWWHSWHYAAEATHILHQSALSSRSQTCTCQLGLHVLLDPASTQPRKALLVAGCLGPLRETNQRVAADDRRVSTAWRAIPSKRLWTREVYRLM